MKILKLEDWLRLFNLQKVSYSEFLKVAKIKNANNEYLRDKIADPYTRKVLYNTFVKKKKKYLINFYNRSLKIPQDIDLNNIKSHEISNSKNKNKKNLIRNLYFKEILLITKTDVRNIRPFLEVLFDIMNLLIIDYKLVTPSGLKYIKENQFSNILSAYYFRSSIMNPSIPFLLSKKILNGKKIFTPTLGWSSYLYGFLSNNEVEEYVGTDVIDKVCTTTREMANHFFPQKKVKIYNSPSEDLYKLEEFKHMYSCYFDIIFFSPPYFKLELYPGKNQSVNKYSDYNTWLLNYWEETIKLCKHVIKPSGKLCYIISGYNKCKNLTIDMNKITEKYFSSFNTYALLNTKFFNRNSENIYIYQTKLIN